MEKFQNIEKRVVGLSFVRVYWPRRQGRSVVGLSIFRLCARVCTSIYYVINGSHLAGPANIPKRVTAASTALQTRPRAYYYYTRTK